MSSKYFANLRSLISEGDLESALNQLLEFAEGQGALSGIASGILADLSSEVIVQMARLRRSKRELRANLVKRDDGELTLNNIASAALSLIEDFERVGSSSILPIRISNIELRYPGEISQEKIFGRNNIQSIAWLHKAISRSRSVCRVVSPGGLGTGFLIRGGYLVTNNHVIGTSQSAKNSFAEFNFEENDSGAVSTVCSFRIDSTTFSTDEILDCTIVGLLSEKGKTIDNWGHLPVNSKSKVEVGEPVSIIQHPEGGLKKICVTSNEVVNIFEQRLQYITGTMPGSSGSPVFNERWDVIALHHAGGDMQKNVAGQRIFANEGILMSEISASEKFSRFFGE
jgi:V8-like Glu-specific endopeptidase